MSEDEKTGSSNPGGVPAGNAGEATPAKRKVRTPEEVLKDIEAEEAEAIRKIQARAAEKKAEVQTKIKAASKKTVAIELLDNFRASIKAACKNEKMSDEEADAVLQKLVDDGLAKLASAPAPSTDAANAAPVAQAA